MIKVISTIAIALVLLSVSSLSASAQFRDYIVTFTINSAVDSRALGGAQVQASSRSANIPSTNVLSDAAGRVTLYLRPGQYLITVRHKGHQAISFVLPVPGPGMQNQMRQTYGAVALKETEEEYESDADWRERRDRVKASSRTLSVTVLGAKRDKNGKTTNVPLREARVKVTGEQFGVGGENFTNRSGVAVFNRPYVIGTELRITASAEGYHSREHTLIVGSRQEGSLDPRYTTRTTTSDYATITLSQKIESEPFSLVIEAVNARTRGPISNARVSIELIGGSQVAAGATNQQGRTRPLVFTPLPSISKNTVAHYRAKVSAPGFQDKWSDIPIEIPFHHGGAGRLYVVHLEPVDQGQSTNQYNLPPQFKNKTVIRIDRPDPILECWAASQRTPCTQPNLESQILVYVFSDGTNFWDRRDYDNKRKKMADAGMVFHWACGKSLWRNGRCG